MIEFVFLRDTVMSRETFERLPEIDAQWLRSVRYGALCRAEIERDGRVSWHAVAWHNLNGADRALASRISIRTYQSEDDPQ